MPRVCHFTGLKTTSGWTKAEKGARRDGGVGNKVKGRTKRRIRPNLKKLRVMIDGEPKKVWVSASAIKRGLVVKPLKGAAKIKADAAKAKAAKV
jgi:large subunit ribosomal protein L28